MMRGVVVAALLAVGIVTVTAVPRQGEIFTAFKENYFVQ